MIERLAALRSAIAIVENAWKDASYKVEFLEDGKKPVIPQMSLSAVNRYLRQQVDTLSLMRSFYGVDWTHHP